MRHGRLVAAMVGLLLAIACSPVFIPLPPPTPPSFSQSETAKDDLGRPMWITTGDPQSTAASADFYIHNITLDLGVMVHATADGSYVAPPMIGEVDNNVELYYVTPNGDASQVRCVKLKNGKTDTPCD